VFFPLILACLGDSAGAVGRWSSNFAFSEAVL